MTEKDFYTDVILRGYDYQKLILLANSAESEINKRAKKLAEEIAKEHAGEIKISLYYDRGNYDDDINICIHASEQVSEQLRPLAQNVEYFVQEITQGRLHSHNQYKSMARRFEALYYRSMLVIAALIITTVLGIIF